MAASGEDNNNNDNNNNNDDDTPSPADMQAPKRYTRLRERRFTVPQELEDPDDLTIGEGQGDFMEEFRKGKKSTTTTPTTTSGTTSNERLLLPKEARNLLGGGIAGITAKSVVAPFDRIKILYQVSDAQFHIWKVPVVARNIVADEGLAALWKGNTATMIRVFPYSGIQFMVFDRMKHYLLQEQHEEMMIQRRPSQANLLPDRKWGLSPLESLGAGMVAGTCSVIMTYPLDLTRAQLAVIKKHRGEKNRGFTGLLKDIYMARGIRGLFRGITPTLLGILPYSGISFALNEQGKREIQHYFKRDVTTIERMQCGAFAGLIAQTLTYPIEVCRRRMQTIGLVGTDTAFGSLGGPSSTAAAPPQALNMINTIKSLYQEQGIMGFYKGVSLNWFKGPIAFSISFTTFDTIKEWMETESERALRLPRRWTIRGSNSDTK